jgi:phosphatidylglycerophosphate synthase
MFDTPLRKIKDRVGTPLARSLSRVSPTTVSLIGLVIALFAAWSAYRQIYFAAFALWILNRVLDGLDGLLARLHNKQSDFGGYVDILTDFVAYAALPIGLVVGSPSSERYLALAFLLASFYINTASWMYLAALLEKRALHGNDTQTSIVMPAGLIGGFETIIAFGVFTLFPTYLTTLYIIFTILVFITIAQRLIWAKRILI